MYIRRKIKNIFVYLLLMTFLTLFASYEKSLFGLTISKKSSNMSKTNESSDKTKSKNLSKKNLDLKFSSSWARVPSKHNKNTAAYLSITNSSDTDYVLTNAFNSELSDKIELHNSFVDENGVSKMVKIDNLVIPKNSEISFVPGGLHIMVLNLKKDLVEGDKINLHLTFEKKSSTSDNKNSDSLNNKFDVTLEFEIKKAVKK